MRLYSWVVMYLEGIHAGIQTAHCQGAISSKYRELTAFGDLQRLSLYQEWESKHSVIQVYNGGYSSSLRERYLKLEKYGKMFGLPYAKWHESQDALDGALTAVGIVVPERYYNRYMIKGSEYTNQTSLVKPPKTDEEDFYELLHNCKHAR
jgi:hypothetical protein